MFYKFQSNRLEEMLASDEAYDSFLEDLDFTTILDSETINDLLWSAHCKGKDLDKRIQSYIDEAWKDHKNNERDLLAESYLD